jgi:hypothetical protein
MALVGMNEFGKTFIHALTIYPTVITHCKGIVVSIVHKANNAPSVLG